MDRRMQYLLFKDFTKSFDKVDRGLLYQKMIRKGYSHQLIKAIQNLTNRTWLMYKDKSIEANLGTPQGSCLSPTVWNLYVADLCEELESAQGNNLDNFLGIINRAP